MGGANGHFNDSAKEVLGWLTSQEIIRDGTYELIPLEVHNNGPKSLKIHVKNVRYDYTYYLSYRIRMGFDDSTVIKSDDIPNGIMVRLYEGSHLLDMTHSIEGDPSNPVLVAGKTYTDPVGGFTISVQRKDPSSLGGAPSMLVTVSGMKDITPPDVSITSPGNNATVSGTVDVRADASDNVGVTKVEFYVNGALKATDTDAPYIYSWDTTKGANGFYTLTAKAYDAAGNSATSSPVSVTVANASVLPYGTLDVSPLTCNGPCAVSVAWTFTGDPNTNVSTAQVRMNDGNTDTVVGCGTQGTKNIDLSRFGSYIFRLVPTTSCDGSAALYAPLRKATVRVQLF